MIILICPFLLITTIPCETEFIKVCRHSSLYLESVIIFSNFLDNNVKTDTISSTSTLEIVSLPAILDNSFKFWFIFLNVKSLFLTITIVDKRKIIITTIVEIKI